MILHNRGCCGGLNCARLPRRCGTGSGVEDEFECFRPTVVMVCRDPRFMAVSVFCPECQAIGGACDRRRRRDRVGCPGNGVLESSASPMEMTATPLTSSRCSATWRFKWWRALHVTGENLGHASDGFRMKFSARLYEMNILISYINEWDTATGSACHAEAWSRSERSARSR